MSDTLTRLKEAVGPKGFSEDPNEIAPHLAEWRGTYEGHHEMPGGDAGRTMTNAAVSGVAGAANGTTLTLKYPDGQQDIVVGPDVPVFAIVPGDRTWLKPGLAVSFFGMKAADGTITARGVFVEHDGQKPMM